MPDIHVVRHGDRWAVKDSPDATPIFETYTLEEAASEARRRCEGGRIIMSGGDAGPEGIGQHPVDAERGPEPHEVREHADPGRSGDIVREQQGGL